MTCTRVGGRVRLAAAVGPRAQRSGAEPRADGRSRIEPGAAAGAVARTGGVVSYFSASCLDSRQTTDHVTPIQARIAGYWFHAGSDLSCIANIVSMNVP